MSATEPIDFLVETKNPEALDNTLQQIGAAVVGRGTPDGIVMKDGYPVVRVFGDPGFFRFACEMQGYCKIVRQLDELVK